MTKQKFNKKVLKLLEEAKELHEKVEAFCKLVSYGNEGQIPIHLKHAHESSSWTVVLLEKSDEISKPDEDKKEAEAFDAPKIVTMEPPRIVRP